VEPAIVVEPFGPPAPPPPERPLRVLVGGDLIPHRPSLIEPTAVATALAPLADLFHGADAVVANYEAATGALSKKAFRMAYAAPAAWLDALPTAGITAVSVANNHACDLGTEGLLSTLSAGQKSALHVLGAADGEDPWAPRVVAEAGGKRVCAVAWTTLVNAEGACARSSRLAFATNDTAGRRKVASAMRRATTTCDATIAIIHGGIEYVPQTPTMMAMARDAAELGADAVVVHHPHVASPVVVHPAKDGRKVPIFASVGNLVSNQGESWKMPMYPVLAENRRMVCVNGWTRLGVLADLAFDFRGAPRLEWGFHLLWTDNEHAETRTPTPKISTRILDPIADGALMTRLSQDTKGPVALFHDGCWRERPDEGDSLASTRCQTTLVRSVPRVTPTVARTKSKPR
jgi:poly-gamma-glutamate synthesis protein (capsule biosynthesis protein)